MIIISCSKEHAVDPESTTSHIKKGVVQLSVQMERIGALRKTLEKKEINLSELYVTLSAEGQMTVYDTIQLTGGSYERTERKIYPGLVAYLNGELVEWKLSVETRDLMDKVIHFDSTSFFIPPTDTAKIMMHCKSRYSMLSARYFPVRDSVTRCEIRIDGNAVADSSFPVQSLVGEEVILSFDYLEASSNGIDHPVELNVYGLHHGDEVLLYTGGGNLHVVSGGDLNCTTNLNYVGPGEFNGALNMDVTLGKPGYIAIDGVTYLFEKHLLTLTTNSQGVTVTGPDSVVHGIPYQIQATPDESNTAIYYARWQVIDGSASIAKPYSTSTTVSLENGDATILGIFYIQHITGGSSYSE